MGEDATCRAIADSPPTLTLPRQGGGDYFVPESLLQISKRTALIQLGKKIFACLASILALLLAGGCASMLAKPLLAPLSRSLEMQRDLKLLKDGAPTLLLTLDALINADPTDKELLMAGVRGYSSYAALLAEFNESERTQELGAKAREYSLRLLTLLPGLDTVKEMPLPALKKNLAACTPEQTASLFWAGQGWAVWVLSQQGSPASLAELPRLELIMLRVLELDENYYYGAAHLFLGFYYGARPALLGGNPEASRLHFEQALAIGKRDFLSTQVMYADTYARAVFDRELFASLLKEVIDHPRDRDEIATANGLARLKAARLLRQIDSIF